MGYNVPTRQLLTPELYEPGKKPNGPVQIDWDNLLTKGLKGFYKLDSIDSYNNLVDGRMLTPYGGISHTVKDGKPCTHFDGVNDTHLSGGLDAHEFGSSDYSVFVWLWQEAASATDGYNCYVSKSEWSGVADRWGINSLTSGSNQTRNAMHDSTDVGNTVADSLHEAAWHNQGLVVRHSETEHYVYVDGVQRNSGVAGASIDTAFDFKIGSWGSEDGTDLANSKGNMNGYLCDVMLWDRALSDDEIMRLYRDPYQILKPIL